MKKIFYLFLSLTVLQSTAQSQKKPGVVPELLTLDLDSTVAYSKMSATFHPNGKEYYFTTYDSQGAPKIMVSYLKGTNWSTPTPLLDGDGMIPVLTKDGQKLYYSSIELTGGDDNKREPNIWVMERKGDEWGSPIPLGPEVNSSDLGEWFPSVADDGTLYFKRSNFIAGVENIYYSKNQDGRHMQAVLLEAAFNESFNIEDPYVAPDQSYIIFSPAGPELYGPMHITFKDQKR